MPAMATITERGPRVETVVDTRASTAGAEVMSTGAGWAERERVRILLTVWWGSGVNQVLRRAVLWKMGVCKEGNGSGSDKSRTYVVDTPSVCFHIVDADIEAVLGKGESRLLYRCITTQL